MELTKTRERELNLKEQLTEANSKIQEWLAKLSDTENKLQLKTQELKFAQDTIQQLEARNCQEGRNIDKQIQEYMEQNNNLKLQILKKEGELECCQRSMQDLQRQLDSEVARLKTFEIDKKNQEEMITLLKDTLKELEDMLQEQGDFLNSKEAELQTSQTEYKELLDKYHALVESNSNHYEDSKTTVRFETERDLLKKQLEDIEVKLDTSNTERDKLLSELKEEKSAVMETEKKLKKAVDEKEKLQAVIRENNQELKAMECTLTEARKEIEELKSQGADKYSEVHLEELKREAEKSSHDLGVKIRTLQCHNKELSFKLSATEEKVKSQQEEMHSMENKLQEFREERDKLVSGLEAVLKKKDMEIKQHKEVIKQMKEKEIQITQNWQSEREQIAAGLQDLNEHRFQVKTEPPDMPANTSPVKHDVSLRADTPLTRGSTHQRGSRPPRPSPPRVSFQSLEESPTQEATEIQTLKSSPGSARRGSRSLNQNFSRAKRGSSRRGKKRPSTDGLENLPPLPKRRSKDSFAETSNVSESDDYSSHLQVDATPPVAAKTLRRTRKKNGSQVDLSKAEETENSGQRPTRNKRTAKHRLLESFRESPMGRTSKRILDSIAETFSPKSPTRSPNKSPLKEDNSGNYSAKGNRGSKDNVNTESQETDKKPSGRRRGRHKLYKEEAYISEPFESTADFVQSPPEDIHKSVTRSLRSRRH